MMIQENVNHPQKVLNSKLLSTLLAACFTVFSFGQVHAASVSVEEQYVTFCGRSDELKDYLAKKGEKITEEDLQNLRLARQIMMIVLKGGEKGFEELSQKKLSGGDTLMEIAISCLMIDITKTLIKEKGCFDLQTEQIAFDGGGIKACEDLAFKL